MAEFKLGRIKFVYQGAWANGTAYVVDDVVTVGGKTYICVISHTASSTFVTDLDANPTKWNLVSDGTQWRGDWTPTTTYNLGDVVVYGGTVYVCNEYHTSATNVSPTFLGLEADLAKWDVLAANTFWRGSWTTSTRYRVRDIVTWGGYTYVCNTAHISNASSTAEAGGLEADLAKWDVFNAGIEYKGPWSGSSVRYKVNDIVSFGANLYICTTLHQSTGTSIDLTKFSIFVNGLEFENSWSDSTEYQLGDLVTYGGNTYTALQNHSNQNPVTATAYWRPFTTGFDFQGDWNSGTSYKIGSVVRLGGYTYLALVDNSVKTVTATNTTVGVDLSRPNQITISDNTNVLTANLPIVFSGTTFGNIVSGTTYYVKTIVDSTHFTISSAPGGATFELTTASGTMTGTTDPKPPFSTYWSRLNSGIRWVGSTRTYTGVSGTNLVGTGSSATFNVSVTGTSYTVAVNAQGSGYALNDKIKILGTALGGLSPANDLTVTVTGVSTTAITTVSNTGYAVSWESGVTYVLGDSVYFGANSYICVAAHVAASGNRPDADQTGQYWNLLASGAESAVLTTQGDMFFYGANGPQRLPIGTDGQVLRVKDNAPEWLYYGQINNLVYVAPNGVDTLVDGQGTTMDKPWKTVNYACQIIEHGYRNINAQELLSKNKQFILKEVNNYVKYTYKVTVSATAASTDPVIPNQITVTSTDILYTNMPIVFSASAGGITAGTTYYVKSIVSNTTFTISTTPSGSTLNLTASSTANTGTFSYSESKTERDAGIVLDAIIYDIGHGGNLNTTKAALAYFNEAGTSYVTGVDVYDIPPFVAALNYLVSVSNNVLENTAPASNYQTLNGVVLGNQAGQLIDVSLTAETGATGLVTSLVSIVTKGLNGGNTTFIPAATVGNTTISVKTGSFPEVLPIVLPRNTAIVGDELRSTTISPAPANINLATDKEKSASAMGRVNSIIADIISNVSVTPTVGNTATQVTTLPAGNVGSVTASDRVVNNISLIRDIIANGPSRVPAFALPTVTGYNTSFLSTYGDGKAQIVQNYEFIKAEISAYLNVNYNAIWTAFGDLYQSETVRDVSFVLDGLQYDMTYGGNTQSLINGSAYYSLGIRQIRDSYLEAVTAALGRLKTIIGQIVQGTSVTPTAGNTVLQVTAGSTGNAGAGTFAQDRVQDVLDWINNGVANAKIEPTAAIALTSSSLQASRTFLLSKKAEIGSDAQQWVYKFFQDSAIDSSLTNRDAQLVVEALADDLVFGSNFASISAGRAYYRLNASAQRLVDNVNNQKSATLGALNFVGQKAKMIAGAGATAQLQIAIGDIIARIRGVKTTTLTSVTTGTNRLTVTSTSGMVANMPITFSNLPANTTATASATNATGNLITLSDTVSNLGISPGQQIYFTGNTMGNIIPFQLYYVKTASSSTITISLTNGGTAVTLATDTGSMTAVINKAGGLVSNKVYWINTVETSTALTITENYKSGSAFVINNTVGSMTASVTANHTPEVHGSISYNNVLETIRGAEVLKANSEFIAREAAAWVSNTFGGTVTSTTASNNRFTTSSAHNLTVGDPIVFSGTNITGSGITIGQTYYVYTVPTTSTFTVVSQRGSTIEVDITLDGTGTMTVTYAYDLAKCLRDTQAYVKALAYDLNYLGNYKSTRAVIQYVNAVDGSQLENMFLVRNGSGIRNITMTGLSGTLTTPNAYGTRRPTAGAYASLDPGFGPNDSNVWIDSRSCYTQNCTMFGTACTGAKIDGALHAGGYRSMVANDYTTIISDGIGVWCTGSNSLTELVSVFNYYGYAGYLAELGGRIRATNGNSSYGVYGVIAEGVDSFEEPINGTVDNRYFDAFITSVVTDAENEIYRFEFRNAGKHYSNASYNISGSGFNAVAIGDEYRDAGVFETRLLDLNDGNGEGGTSYVTNANVAQGGAIGYITIAATDTLLSGAYVGMRIQLTAGTGVGQYANILTYNNGSKDAQVYKDSFTPLTVTGSTTTVLQVASTATLYVNQPIFLSAATAGVFNANTVYYVASVDSATTFTLKTTVGGSAVTGLTATSGQTISLYEAGWDHVIPGRAVVNNLDLTTAYIIEPRVSYSAPGFNSAARTMPGANAQWNAVKYANGNYVAIANGPSTRTAYSSNGTSWTAGGALPASANWSDITYGGGQGATATVTIGGRGGVGATFEAVIGTGTTATQIVAINVLNGGFGYSTPPVIKIQGGGGTGATATCTVLNGTIQTVSMLINGSGYTSQPSITAETNQVTVITANTWGQDYYSAPSVVIEPPVAGANPWGNGLSVNPGDFIYYLDTAPNPDQTNYYVAITSGTLSATPPTFTDGIGSAATYGAQLGYVGTLATATATLTNNGVSGYTITNRGVGYSSVPAVTIVDTGARFVAVADGSTDSSYQTVAALGSAWSASNSTGQTTLKSITYGNGVYVAVGGNSGTATAVSSTDGVTWINRSSAIASLSAGNYSAITYGNGTFVAIQTGGVVTSTSANGVTWAPGGNLPASTTWSSVAYGNGRFVAIETGGRRVAYSINKGVSWILSPAGLPLSANWSKVAYGQGLFIAIASGQNICATSTDGVTWKQESMPGSSTNWKALAFGNPLLTAIGNQPTWVAISNTSGTIASSIRTGARTQGRIRALSGKVQEFRIIDPGSGYAKGIVTATDSATDVITVADTTNLVNNQPIDFEGLDDYGLATGTTYYIISGSIVANTSFKVSAVSGSSTSIPLTTGSGLSGVYRASPIVSQFDPNKVVTAPIRVRTGDGALANPSFSNRGVNNATATATLTGDGYADTYQNTSFINMANLFTIPSPGANVQFASIPNTWYKLVAVTNVLGTAGNYTAQFQISPGLTTSLAPEHDDVITTRLKYSQVRLTGHDFLYIGTGNQTQTNYPNVDASTAIQANQQLATAGGRVFFTSTDQDGNFNVGNLFGVQQATGTATLNASAFNLAGLQSLQLGAVSIGVGSAVITQFSTDPYFTANSDNVIPTQKAIKSYIAAQIGGGQSTLNVNTITSGQIYIANNTITTTTGGEIKVTARMNFVGGIDGAPVALVYFGQR